MSQRGVATRKLAFGRLLVSFFFKTTQAGQPHIKAEPFDSFSDMGIYIYIYIILYIYIFRVPFLGVAPIRQFLALGFCVSIFRESFLLLAFLRHNQNPGG